MQGLQACKILVFEVGVHSRFVCSGLKDPKESMSPKARAHKYEGRAWL